MSNALAISAVTALLKRLLEDTLAEADVVSLIGSVNVSALPPDRVTPPNQADPNQLNLFLYQTVPNAGWSNARWPTRDSDGARTGSAPLALNLRYLVTAYGAAAYASEILLGHAMRTFHEYSAIPRELVQRLLNPTPAPAGWIAGLGKSGLAEQVEQIKITPESISTEEMSRLWGALQAKYRTTAVYMVSVVLIESGKPFKPALPVAGRIARASALPTLAIRSIETADGQPLIAGSTLRILGSGFVAGNTEVRIGEVTLTPALGAVRANEIQVQVADPPPAGLQAGILAVQVSQTTDLGNPPVPHRTAESNVMPVVLHPSATFTPQNIVTENVNGITVAKGSVRVTLKPAVTRNQTVQLLLNEFQPANTARGYAFNAAAGNGIPANQTEAGAVDIEIKGVVPGQYLVRVRVAGAESLLGMVGGEYASPLVAI